MLIREDIKQLENLYNGMAMEIARIKERQKGVESTVDTLGYRLVVKDGMYALELKK